MVNTINTVPRSCIMYCHVSTLNPIARSSVLLKYLGYNDKVTMIHPRIIQASVIYVLHISLIWTCTYYGVHDIFLCFTQGTLSFCLAASFVSQTMRHTMRLAILYRDGRIISEFFHAEPFSTLMLMYVFRLKTISPFDLSPIDLDIYNIDSLVQIIISTMT